MAQLLIGGVLVFYCKLFPAHLMLFNVIAWIDLK